MKQATCRNLRGACDAVIPGETAAAMGAASKQHVMQMLQAGDAAHKQAMDEMMQLSQADQEKWYGEFVAGFAALPDAYIAALGRAGAGRPGVAIGSGRSASSSCLI